MCELVDRYYGGWKQTAGYKALKQSIRLEDAAPNMLVQMPTMSVTLVPNQDVDLLLFVSLLSQSCTKWHTHLLSLRRGNSYTLNTLNRVDLSVHVPLPLLLLSVTPAPFPVNCLSVCCSATLLLLATLLAAPASQRNDSPWIDDAEHSLSKKQSVSVTRVVNFCGTRRLLLCLRCQLPTVPLKASGTGLYS